MTDISISKDLHRFFAAYFHQDWDSEADDWDGIVDLYAQDLPNSEQLTSLANEIDQLRNADSDNDLEQFLVDNVGMFYAPEPLTYTTWLGEVAERLRQRAVGLERKP